MSSWQARAATRAGLLPTVFPTVNPRVARWLPDSVRFPGWVLIHYFLIHYTVLYGILC